MPANETYRDPVYVPIAEPGSKLLRDISSMGIASKDGAAARAQQEKIAIARARAKNQSERLAHLEQSINTLSTLLAKQENEQASIKSTLELILEKLNGR